MKQQAFDSEDNEIGTFDGTYLNLTNGLIYELHEGAFYEKGDIGGTSYLGQLHDDCIVHFDGKAVVSFGKRMPAE